MLSCAGAADGCTFRVRSLHIKGLPPSAASPPLAHAQRSHAVGAARAARASYAPHRRGGSGGMALANILIVALLPLLAACAAAARRAKQAATWTEVRRVIPPPPFLCFWPHVVTPNMATYDVLLIYVDRCLCSSQYEKTGGSYIWEHRA